LLGLFLWALCPLLISLRFIRQQMTTRGWLQEAWIQMVPHLGSTAMIGITVYVFRLLILLIVGKETAGDLFTAFALGSVLGSAFANALGPSLVLHEMRTGEQCFPWPLKMTLGLWAVAGVTLFLALQSSPASFQWTGKSNMFWGAVGLSMIGGVIMVFGQRMRLQVLQRYEDNDVYGPDVLTNILVLLSVPFLYYLWGRDVLMTLYLLNSIFALLFYASSKAGSGVRSKLVDLSGDTGRLVIPFLIFFPLFFQLSGNIFHDSTFVFDSQGALTRVPLPISLVACFAGILLFGGYKRAHLSLGIIFLSFVLLLTSSMISTHGRGIEGEAKIILLLQFIVPMCALVLGQVYYEDRNPDRCSVEKAFLYVLALVVPVQLLLTWLQGHVFLSPNLLVFSIYQHIQYVPLMFVCGYLIGLYGLWGARRYRSMMVILAPLMGIYVSASASMVAMASLIGGMCGLVIYRWRDEADRLLKIAFMLVIVTSGSYLNLARNTGHFLSEKFTFRKVEHAGASLEEMNEILPIVATRIQYWRYYAGKIGESSKELLFGHSERLDRSKYPSAHNYYLDLVYNFGLLALLPLLTGMGYTLWMVYRCRKTILASSSFLGLAIVVLLVLFVDNSLKVGLRQPYPGMISFFLWGILLSRLYRASVMGQELEKSFL